MEKTTITIKNNVKEDCKKNYQLFEWTLLEEKNDLSETTLTFFRDNEVPYYQELVKLENRFNNVYTIPSWISYILIGLILIYVSLMAILFISKAIDIKKEMFVLILAVPTGILLLTNIFISYLRHKQLMEHINNKEKKYLKYQSLIEQIKK